MKINELKVGNKVKYTDNLNSSEATIIEIRKDGFQVKREWEFFVPFWAVISKLDPYESCGGVIKYKEIPIEKEENPYWIPVVKTISHPYNIPETTYHCPKCDKQLWGTCGMPIKEYSNESCEECKNKEKSASIDLKKVITMEIKEKSAPKSFRFDISFVDRLEFNQDPFTPHNVGSCFFRIDGSKITYHADNPKNFPEAFDGKEYTIEIKEKQS